MDPKEKEKQFKGKRKPGKGDKRAKDSKYLKDKEKKPYEKGPNDPRWRTGDETMTKLVANLPFGLAAGLTQEIPVDSINNYKGKVVQPGIVVLSTYLTLGDSRDYNSAINLAARKIYSFVRHANSGSRNYEAVDMAMFFGSMMQLIGLLGFLQRALRITQEYSATNRYTPTNLLIGMGLNPDDLIAEQPRLKYIIAWLGRVIRSFAIPDLPIFHAAYEAFQYVYVDNDSPKEQFYLITPANIGIYDPTYDTNGGGIKLTTSDQLPLPTATAANRLTVAQLFTYVKARTDILLGDEDIGIIAGDILKAFNQSGKLFMPEAWSLDYPVFQHSPEVLQQIHNAHVFKDTVLSVAGYKQNPGSTGTAPFVLSDISGLPSLGTTISIWDSTIIDAFSREPDPKEVVNCMVFNAQAKIKSYGGSPTTYGIDTDTLAFDLFLPAGLFVKRDAAMSSSYIDESLNFQRGGTRITTGGIDSYLTNFDWHPMRWYVYPAGGTNYFPEVYGDIQNMRIFNYDVGKRIHDNSILNLLNFQEINFY